MRTCGLFAAFRRSASFAQDANIRINGHGQHFFGDHGAEDARGNEMPRMFQIGHAVQLREPVTPGFFPAALPKQGEQPRVQGNHFGHHGLTIQAGMPRVLSVLTAVTTDEDSFTASAAENQIFGHGPAQSRQAIP